MFKAIAVCTPTSGRYWHISEVNIAQDVESVKHYIWRRVHDLSGVHLPADSFTLFWKGEVQRLDLSKNIAEQIDLTGPESQLLTACFIEHCENHVAVNLEDFLSRFRDNKARLLAMFSEIQNNAEEIRSRIETKLVVLDTRLRNLHLEMNEEIGILASEFRNAKEKTVMKYSTQIFEVNEMRELLHSELSDVYETQNKCDGLKQFAVSELECPVMKHTINPPNKVFQCSRGHLVCKDCLYRHGNVMRLIRCPTCREDFHLKSPQRNLFAEKISTFCLSRSENEN